MHSVHSPRRLSSGLMPHVAFAVLVIAARALSSSAVQAGFGGGVQSGSSVSSAGALQSTPSSSSSGDYGGPPMGWSSWTSHAGPVSEEKLYEVAKFLVSSGMAAAGYNILTLDEGWSQSHDRETILLDEYGRPAPNPDMYPSSKGGAGMKPIADKLHSMGLRLGLWMLRGIPVSAVEAKSEILGGGGATADQIIRLDKNCSWSKKAVGSTFPNPAAAAYYNSVAKQLSDWDVDFVKADCMFPGTPFPPLAPPTGYFDDDLFGITGAFQATPGITLSLSPGISMTPWNATTIAEKKLAKMYRITEDLWDLWESPYNGSFPTGIKQKFSVAIKYAKFIGQGGTFPDLDILPIGVVYHADPGKSVYGPASQTRLTKDEQRTAVTLWSFFRSPLFFGGQLPSDDKWLIDLVTNREILAIARSSTGNSPLFVSAADGKGAAGSLFGWDARPANGQCTALASGAKQEACMYVGLFNADNAQRTFGAKLSDVFPEHFGSKAKVSGQGGSSSTVLCARDLWARKPYQVPSSALLSASGGKNSSSSSGGSGGRGASLFSASIPAHGSMAFLLSVVSTDKAGGKSAQEICGI